MQCSANFNIQTKGCKQIDKICSRYILCIIPLDNPHQRSRVPVLIKVLDVNDNAPEFAMIYETFVCENVKAGQVFITTLLCYYLVCFII